MKELKEIRYKLIEMAEKEATQMFRLAWRAKAHGCKPETVEAIRNEGRWLHETATAYPDRLIRWQFEYEFKYAFRLGGVDMAATLVRVNGVGKVGGKVHRKVLERNALDMMTMDPEVDFEEALERVEEMSLQELVEYLEGEGE